MSIESIPKDNILNKVIEYIESIGFVIKSMPVKNRNEYMIAVKEINALTKTVMLLYFSVDNYGYNFVLKETRSDIQDQRMPRFYLEYGNNTPWVEQGCIWIDFQEKLLDSALKFLPYVIEDFSKTLSSLKISHGICFNTWERTWGDKHNKIFSASRQNMSILFLTEEHGITDCYSVLYQ